MKTTFLNQLLIVMAAAVMPVITSAQSAADTIAVRELGEIVVRAPKVIRKADMDIISQRVRWLTRETVCSF